MAYHGHGGSLETSAEVRANLVGREIEYNMSRAQFNTIANNRPKNDTNPQPFVMSYLNNIGGLMGKVVKINIDEEPIHIIHTVDDE